VNDSCRDSCGAQIQDDLYGRAGLADEIASLGKLYPEFRNDEDYAAAMHVATKATHTVARLSHYFCTGFAPEE